MQAFEIKLPNIAIKKNMTATISSTSVWLIYKSNTLWSVVIGYPLYSTGLTTLANICRFPMIQYPNTSIVNGAHLSMNSADLFNLSLYYGGFL